MRMKEQKQKIADELARPTLVYIYVMVRGNPCTETMGVKQQRPHNVNRTAGCSNAESRKKERRTEALGGR